MKSKERIQKKKWIKPELKTLGFKQTFGGTDPIYTEQQGGIIS